ncbi:MAG: hypothetical protein ACYTEL_00500, partial [Planctomycetota bacterium]
DEAADDYVKRGTQVNIYGTNFGNESGEVRIGTRKGYTIDPLNKGRVLKLSNRLVPWSQTLIKAKVKGPCKWEGRTRYIWVIDSTGQVSNKRAINIIEPLQGGCSSEPSCP